MAKITTAEALRRLYQQPSERAVKKQLTRLDAHCRRFIELSPFVVIASGGSEHGIDASPRGGLPGFVKIEDDNRLLLPDWPGNNRLDTFINIVESGEVGMIFFVPGVDEVLRINGPAELLTDEALLESCCTTGKRPKLVVSVTVREAFLHCAKALMRSRLWASEARVERSDLPSLGQMLKDQMGSKEPAESQEEMVACYEKVLY